MRIRSFIIFISCLIIVKIVHCGNWSNSLYDEMFKDGQRYEKEGNLEKTVEIYYKIFENAQENFDKKRALSEICRIYEKEKKYKEAIEFYKKYLNLDTTISEKCCINIRIAYCYIYQKEYNKGFQILDEIIKGFPNNRFSADAQFAKADIYHNIIKNYGKAIEKYEKMTENYPNDWRVKDSLVLRKIAYCYLESKDYDKSIEIYKKISTEYKDTPFEKYANLMIEFIQEYFKKGKEVPPEIIMKRMKEVGLGEGIISEEEIDGRIIYKVK